MLKRYVGCGPHGCRVLQIHGFKVYTSVIFLLGRNGLVEVERGSMEINKKHGRVRRDLPGAATTALKPLNPKLARLKTSGA